jgi:Sulfotransferase domain
MSERHHSVDEIAARLPDFVAVGPARTGTTWLHGMLSHRVLLPRNTKETHYFDLFYDRGLDWYQAYFAGYPRDRLVGEVTPAYFPKPEVRERMARVMPACRIICTLRDPVERAYSTYRMLIRSGFRVQTFEQEAVRPGSLIFEGNRYASHLRGWQELFGADNVATFLYDQLQADEQAFADSVCDFLGAARIDLSEIGQSLWRNSMPQMPRNVRIAGWVRHFRFWLKSRHAERVVLALERWGVWRFFFDGPKKFPPLDPEIEARMRTFFLPEVEALEKLLDKDLTAWRTGRLGSTVDMTVGASAPVQASAAACHTCR